MFWIAHGVSLMQVIAEHLRPELLAEQNLREEIPTYATGESTMEFIVRSARSRVLLRLKLGISVHRAKMSQI